MTTREQGIALDAARSVTRHPRSSTHLNCPGSVLSPFTAGKRRKPNMQFALHAVDGQCGEPGAKNRPGCTPSRIPVGSMAASGETPEPGTAKQVVVRVFAQLVDVDALVLVLGPQPARLREVSAAACTEAPIRQPRRVCRVGHGRLHRRFPCPNRASITRNTRCPRSPMEKMP